MCSFTKLIWAFLSKTRLTAHKLPCQIPLPRWKFRLCHAFSLSLACVCSWEEVLGLELRIQVLQNFFLPRATHPHYLYLVLPRTLHHPELQNKAQRDVHFPTYVINLITRVYPPSISPSLQCTGSGKILGIIKVALSCPRHDPVPDTLKWLSLPLIIDDKVVIYTENKMAIKFEWTKNESSLLVLECLVY